MTRRKIRCIFPELLIHFFLDNYTSRHISIIVVLFGLFKVFFLFYGTLSFNEADFIVH